MPKPSSTAAVAEPAQDAALTKPASQPRDRAVVWTRRALAAVPRISILAGLLLWLSLPFDSSLLTAFAEPSLQMTPTPTPYGGSVDPYFTATPTPYGYNGNQYGGQVVPDYQNQYQATYTPTPFGQPSNQGIPNSQYPSNQYPNQQIPGSQYPGGVPPQGGVPGQQSVQSPGGLPGAIVPSGAASPIPGQTTDPCYGDELVTFAPEMPRVGDELLIAVTSSRPHPYGRLAGTELTRFSRERPGQRGIVWEWLVQLSYPGQQEYTFYVDSTIPCQKIQLTVRGQLATRTQTPTKVPTPYGFDNGNSNGNNNSNNNDNNNSNNSTAPAVNPAAYVIPGQNAYDCGSFESQSNAQRVLRYDASDPNRLDAEDGFEDGIACTTYNYSRYPNDRDFNAVQRVYGTVTPTPNSGSFNPYNYLGQGDRYGCRDFSSQANAQAVLRADSTDPNRLDTNPRNGVACEQQEATQDGVPGGSMPGPYDMQPVPR